MKNNNHQPKTSIYHHGQEQPNNAFGDESCEFLYFDQMICTTNNNNENKLLEQKTNSEVKWILRLVLAMQIVLLTLLIRIFLRIELLLSGGGIWISGNTKK